MCGHTRDPIIYSEFHRNPFRGFGAPGGQNLAFPITLASRFYNSLYYRDANRVIPAVVQEIIASLAGAVAKYGNEHVCMSLYLCLSVCLSASISPESHARWLPIFLCMLPMAVARSLCGRVTKSQGEVAILGISSLLTMHCLNCIAVWISLRRTDLA